MMRLKNREVILNDHSLRSIAAKFKFELEGDMPEAWLSWRLWPKPAVVSTHHVMVRVQLSCFPSTFTMVWCVFLSAGSHVFIVFEEISVQLFHSCRNSEMHLAMVWLLLGMFTLQTFQQTFRASAPNCNSCCKSESSVSALLSNET